MKINIGSLNKTKIKAVEDAFRRYYSDFEVRSSATESKVNEIPASFEEILQGAKNRALSSFKDCDLSIGIESGIYPSDNSSTGYFLVCACIIYDGKKTHLGLSPQFEYHTSLTNKKYPEEKCVVGFLTKDKYTRKDFIESAVIMALLPIINKEIYET